MNTTELPKFESYINREELLPLVKHHFSTDQSLLWFVRTHHKVLAETGAIINITNRIKFEPTIFRQQVIEIGRNAALSRKAG